MKKLVAFKFLPLLFIVALGACENDDDAVARENKCLLNSVEIEGSRLSDFTYDSNKRMVKTTYDNVSTSDYYEEFEYNAAGKVEKYKMFGEDGNQIDYFLLEYDSNGLLKKESYFWRLTANSNYQHEYDRVFEYNSNKQLVKVSSFEPGETELPGSIPDKYELYTYDANGNVSKIMEYVNGSAGTQNTLITEYTYDNKKNPWQDQVYLGATAAAISKNNVLTEKETSVLSGQVKNYTHTYNYNEVGFPTKITTKLNNGNSMVTNFEYSCF